ncbi:hypothetical protein TRFO_41709 [Tritrichomonas foetus]|uniref:Uncharacterized protein n=1 Tax=Tritrichomonas foetus TaxID=1144522 RepID=A0A1J4L3S2_9EUKA|nr:hypothetical protein TRFO_41709 [Tritrichomonas foetus]|eukprot:OHT16598.1 hypothetical protein TRFO_41709 [Tritrichomonas foetus]
MSRASPQKQRSTDIKQDKLDEETTRIIIKCGGGNNAQARYFQELSSHVVGNENEAFESLQPDMKITNAKAWRQAVCLVNAYLKRYRMELTLQTIKTEYVQNPKSTGYKSASVVDSTMKNLLKLSKDIKNINFEERAQEFNDELQQKILNTPKKSRLHH